MGGKQPFAGAPRPLAALGAEWWCCFPLADTGKRCLGRDLGRVEGPSPDSDRSLQTLVMECRKDLPLPSLRTGPPGACWWSPAGSGVELAVHVFTLTSLFVCSSYPSSRATDGSIAAIASAPLFPNCDALGAGCVSATTGTLPSSYHASLSAS